MKIIAKYYSVIVGVVMVSLMSVAGVTVAASVVLTNGGLGQVAGNTQSFGLAVCNNGKQAVMQPVPVLVSANGMATTISSASSIQPGVCQYSYANYSDLAMMAGQTYAVSVTIDPGHT